MEQDINNTFEYVESQENTPTIQNSPIEQEVNMINNTEPKQAAEDFVTGLPSWDLTPPYEVIRRVTR